MTVNRAIKNVFLRDILHACFINTAHVGPAFLWRSTRGGMSFPGIRVRQPLTLQRHRFSRAPRRVSMLQNSLTSAADRMSRWSKSPAA